MQLTFSFDGHGPSTQHAAPSIQHASPDFSFVRHPRARHYIVRVGDDGTARVTIPRGGSKREAREFVRRQRSWIEKERRRIEAERAAPREELPPELERELRARAKRELPARLLVLARVHGVAVSRTSVRNQRWRWGSCSRSGHISLNWRLAHMPGWVRDYVMIHELMHLKRMDHSRKFWRLVADACPDYERARRWLRESANDTSSWPSLARLQTTDDCPAQRPAGAPTRSIRHRDL